MTWTIWHNPRCGKSRQTLALLRAQGIEPEIFLYLKTPPDRERLEAALQRLGLSAVNLVRQRERVFKELGLNRDELNHDQCLQAMVDQPILIERPIVEFGSSARIGRPPETVLELLNCPPDTQLG
ncbi:MAG: arsenate reductase (glutaredoxin) [Myxococcota bacterium]|nr:arsenate reductase (glutaredoxin) [Myxococcota bacterium]